MPFTKTSSDRSLSRRKKRKTRPTFLTGCVNDLRYEDSDFFLCGIVFFVVNFSLIHLQNTNAPLSSPSRLNCKCCPFLSRMFCPWNPDCFYRRVLLADLPSITLPLINLSPELLPPPPSPPPCARAPGPSGICCLRGPHTRGLDRCETSGRGRQLGPSAFDWVRAGVQQGDGQ